MQNLSVADIFPSSIPEHPRVQNPMPRDVQGKQFSDYFTPPGEPVYQPLSHEPGQISRFPAGTAAGGNPATDPLYAKSSYNNETSDSHRTDGAEASRDASRIAADNRAAERDEYTRRAQDRDTANRQAEKHAAEASAEKARKGDQAGSSEKQSVEDHADSGEKHHLKQDKTAKQASTRGAEQSGRQGSRSGEEGRQDAAALAAKESPHTSERKKEAAAKTGESAQKAAKAGKGVADTGRPGEGLKASKDRNTDQNHMAGGLKQRQSEKSSGNESTRAAGKTAGKAAGKGSVKLPEKLTEKQNEAASPADQKAARNPGISDADAQENTSLNRPRSSGKAAEGNEEVMTAAKHGGRNGEGSAKHSVASSSRTGDPGNNGTVQSSILSQSMDRISGRGNQSGSPGSSSQTADAGDSKVLSSMVQQARDGGSAAFQGNGGDGGAGDSAKQGGTFNNSMFAQSGVQPGASMSSSSDFQVFLGPEALTRGPDGLQNGQNGRNSSAGTGGKQTMSSSEMMNQFKEQFRGQLGSDVVRQARYIFKGQNSGEISMVLKPEKLGRVRIKVNLQDNSVAGKIFVENKDVEAAFTEMLGELKEMFQDQGFDDLSVDVQLDDGNGDDTPEPFSMGDDNGLAGNGEQAGRFENQIAQARNYLREFESLDILA